MIVIQGHGFCRLERIDQRFGAIEDGNASEAEVRETHEHEMVNYRTFCFVYLISSLAYLIELVSLDVIQCTHW